MTFKYFETIGRFRRDYFPGVPSTRVVPQPVVRNNKNELKYACSNVNFHRSSAFYDLRNYVSEGISHELSEKPRTLSVTL